MRAAPTAMAVRPVGTAGTAVGRLPLVAVAVALAASPPPPRATTR